MDTVTQAGRPALAAILLAVALASGPSTTSAAGRPDPRTLAYLDGLGLDRLPPVDARAGRQLRMVDRLPVAEVADDDLVAGLRNVSITVSQVSGPRVAIEHADGPRARATMPDVAVPTALVFEVVMRNAGGERRGRLTVNVRP